MYRTAPDERILAALRRAVPTVAVQLVTKADGVTELAVGATRVRACWIERGWPREVRVALAARPRVDVLVAPSMSPGARAAARAEGVGWMDESGGAEFAVGPVVVVRDGARQEPTGRGLPGWTPATAAVAEALLLGATASVAAVASATGLSTGAVTNALAFLASEGLLVADAARGRYSGRRVGDRDALLSAYADAVSESKPRPQLRLGVLWRSPVDEALAVGRRWESHGRMWAATGALAAAVLAPLQTEVGPLVLYVVATSVSDLHVAASEASLEELSGGRLLVRAFPSPATARLSARSEHGLQCAPWPRVFADLHASGVRGEDAAEYLRERMLGREAAVGAR